MTCEIDYPKEMLSWCKSIIRTLCETSFTMNHRFGSIRMYFLPLLIRMPG